MESILRYKDYRKYIRDYYAREKKASAFSWRKFSKLANFSSPNFLKQVCDGVSNLSKNSAERVADAMSLQGYEKKFFLNLVVFNQSQIEEKRDNASQEMARIIKENKVRKLGNNALTYYDTWIHAIVRELAPIMEKVDAESIVKRCRLRISKQDAEESLAFLLRAGLLGVTNKGKYVQTEKIVEGNGEDIPLAIRSMNRQMAQLAEHALDEVPVEHREFTGITMGISKESYGEILKELGKCRKKILDIVSKEEKVDRVYRLNFQLFPMTVIEEESEDEDF